MTVTGYNFFETPEGEFMKITNYPGGGDVGCEVLVALKNHPPPLHPKYLASRNLVRIASPRTSWKYDRSLIVGYILQ